LAALLVFAASLTTACGGGDDPAAGAAAAAAESASRRLADRYLAVAFGNRFGPPPHQLRRWQGTVVVRPTGAARYEDRFRLRLLVAQLAPVLGGTSLDLAEWDDRPADLDIRYLPLQDFKTLAPEYGDDYLSHLRLRSDPDGRLRSALLLLPSDEAVPQYMRDSLLVEGLAACLGLAGGVDEPWDSAFYARPNWDAWTFLASDLDLVALHYRDDLATGMTRRQVAQRLRSLEAMR
jgi:hypothetical protein